jgi:NAD(P)H-flavin reductase
VNRDPMIPEWFSVQDIKNEIDSVVSFDLIPPEKHDELAGRPGQFNMLYVFGQGEIPISISGHCSQTKKWHHTVRNVGAVSNALCSLKEGQKVGVRGPFGTSWPIDEAKGKDIIFIAGGLGLAPLRPAIYHYLSHAQNYGKASLFYGTRNPQGILYPDELHSWAEKSPLDIFVSVDSAQKSDKWKGHVGLITPLLELGEFEPSNTVAFLCGPEVMMRFLSRDLKQRGLDDDNIFLSMERNMKCAIGHCGHCQLGSEFVCKDGPVFTYKKMEKYLTTREL